jgi:hypothetical protein
MKPDYDRLVEAQRRDLELGRALAGLPQPDLPEDIDARLRAAIEKELRRARRRPATIELIVLAVIVLVVGAVLAWRYVPPSATTMGEVRAAIETRRNALIPTPPGAAIARGEMTPQERTDLERQVAAEIAACCTPRFALERIVEDDAVNLAVEASAELLADGVEWPAPVARQPLGEVVFVRRTWDGAIVVRLDQPGFDRAEDRADHYVLRRVDGRWLIDEIDHRGA